MQPLSSASYKIIVYSTLLFGTLNFFFFNAVLISYLIASDDNLKIETLADVLRHPELQLIQFRGYSSNSHFSQPTTRTAKQLWEKTIRNNPDAYVGNMEEAVKKMAGSSHYVLLIPEGTTVDIFFELSGSNCQLVASKNTLIRTSVGIAVQKGSPYKGFFKSIINQAREAGLIEKMYRSTAVIKRKEDCSFDDSGIPSIGYESIASAFLVILIGIVCSVVLACLERMKRTTEQNMQNSYGIRQ